MMNLIRILALSIVIVCGSLYGADVNTPKPEQIFVPVDENVKLEVLDWGGSGRPVVLLAGLGDDAHVFDGFARKLTPKYHVYGITRRGFGASSVPSSGYSSERLGEDVIAVLTSLKIDRPILAGHSIAGSELSFIGTVHPERIAALIYLDAVGAFAFYVEGSGNQMNLLIDLMELQKQIEEVPSADARNLKQLNRELLISVKRIEKELLNQQENLKEMPDPPKGGPGDSLATVPSPRHRVLGGLHKYKDIRLPILAICADPPSSKELGGLPPTIVSRVNAEVAAQTDAFEKGVPSAHVVRIAQASHYVFKSNEADVLREIEQFVGNLPPKDKQPNLEPRANANAQRRSIPYGQK